MRLEISGILEGDALKEITAAARALPMEDGVATASGPARERKRNLQAAKSEARTALQTRIADAFRAHKQFNRAVLPLKLTPALISLTGEGGGYGRHVDNSFMGRPPVRTDVSMTLFLCEPDAYEGGELMMIEDGTETRIKCRAGSVFIYPSHVLHEVATVTSGERLVSVHWAQSFVRAPEQRRMIDQLDQVRAQLLEDHGPIEAYDHISNVRANMLRMWGEV